MSKTNESGAEIEKYVAISKVRPNGNEPVEETDQDTLQELRDSIKEYGVLFPILVTEKDDYYEIVAGKRRWMAAQMAGLEEVPVIIRDELEEEA